MHQEINSYLIELQEESPNCGGQYHFRKISLPTATNLVERLRYYLLKIEAYEKPFIEINGEQRIVENRQVENLKLVLISDFKNIVEDRLKYWREHRTSLHCRENLSEYYYPKEVVFKKAIFNFLENLEDLKAYEIDGIDTYFAHEISGDMVGDDIIFESKNETYVLHFGWSS